MTGAPYSHDEHDLDLPSDGVREITPAAAPALNPEQIVPSEDGWMDPATRSEPLASVTIESDWAPIMEFSSADIFQHSPLGDVLNSLRSLSLSGGPWPNCVRLEWEADDEEIRSPPTTHLIATVDDLSDMLDFGSEDIDGMDEDAGEEHEPPPTGR